MAAVDGSDDILVIASHERSPEPGKELQPNTQRTSQLLKNR